MGAYLEAMRGDDGHTRDSKGKARFNKSQGKRGRGEDDEGGMEGVEEPSESLKNTGRREKKPKRETVKIGAEFKAKVSLSFNTRFAWQLTEPRTFSESWWRHQEGRCRTLCLHSFVERRWKEQGSSGTESRHYWTKEGIIEKVMK